MKQNNFRFFYRSLFLGVCIALSGCSDRIPEDEPDHSGTDVSKPEATAGQLGLSETSSAEYLAQATAWAEDKTPDEMVAELAKENWNSADEEELFWRYYVTQVAFLEAYGQEEGNEKMSEAFDASRQDSYSMSTHQVSSYRGKLSEEYPEIYEIALKDPDQALKKLDEILIHPNTLEALQGEVLSVYGREHPEKALAMLEAKTNIVAYPAQKAIVLDWAKKDPEAAINYVDTLNEKRSMLGLRHQLLLEMVEYNPILALEAAIDSPINHQTNWTLEKVAESYVRGDPEAGYEWLMAQEALSDNLLEAGVDGLTSKYPDLADALMRSVPPDRWQSQFVSNIARKKAIEDIEGALAWASDLPWESHRSRAYGSVLDVMAREQPERFVAQMDSIQSFGISPKAYSNILENFAQRHPQTALNWAQNAPDSPASAYIYGQAARRLIRENPNQTGSLLAATSEGAYKSKVLGEIVEGWIGSQPQQAIGWVRGEATPKQLNQFVPEIASEWFQVDKASALKFVEELPPGKARESLLRQYVYSDSERNLEDVVRFVDAVEGGNNKYSLMQSAFGLGADVQPQKARALVATIKDPASRDGAIYGTVLAFAEIDPKGTAEWAESMEFAEEQTLEYTFNKLVDSFGEKKSSEMTEWVLGISDKQKRHAAALRAAQKVVKADAAMASRLINQAQPGRSRGLQIINALQVMPDRYSRDAFVSSISLSKEEQELIQSEREKRNF